MSMLQRAAFFAALVVGGLAPLAAQEEALLKADAEESMRAMRQDALWRERLLEPDLDRREHHFRHLIDAVLRAPELREMLARWAADASRPELAWTSRLALRELAQQPAWVFRAAAKSGGLGPANPWFSERPPMLGLPDVQALLRDAAVKTISLEFGADGVLARIEQEEDGERHTKTYRAATKEELLAKHPELADYLQLGSRLQVRGQRPSGLWGQADGDAPELRTDVLGVIVREIDSEERAFLGLAEGLGLTVREVGRSTIAASLGLRPGHVLVEVNGHPLAHEDDIPRALALRAENGEVTVTAVDRLGRLRKRGWRPAPEPDAAGPAGSAEREP